MTERIQTPTTEGYPLQPGKDYTFDSIALETPLPGTATIPVVPGSKRQGDVITPLVPVLPSDTVITPADTTYYVEAPTTYVQPPVAVAEGVVPVVGHESLESAPAGPSVGQVAQAAKNAVTPSAQTTATAQSYAQSATETLKSAAQTAGALASQAAVKAQEAVAAAAPVARDLATSAQQTAGQAAQKVQQTVASATAPSTTTTTSTAPVHVTGTSAYVAPRESLYESNLAESGPGAAALPGGSPVALNAPTTILTNPGTVHIPGTPANLRPLESTYEDKSVAVPTVNETTAASAAPTYGVSGVSGISGITASIPSASQIAAQVPPAPVVAARAGEVTGSAVGAVGGTLATAAEIAKNAASSLLGAVSAPKERSVEDELKPSLTVRAAATTGSVAGSVAGTIATLAGAAKSAVTSVLPHQNTAVTETAVSTEVRPEQKYDLAYNAGNLAVLEGEEVRAVVPPSDLAPPTNRAGEGVPTITEKISNTAALTAASAANTAVAAKDSVVSGANTAATAASNAASSAYQTAASTATAAKDSVVGAANVATDRAIAAKDSAVATAYSAKDSAADKAAYYSAGHLPNTGGKYELVESDLLEGKEDIRPVSHSAVSDDVHTGQRAIAAGPSSTSASTDLPPLSSFGAGPALSTGSTTGPDLSLPTTTETPGLLSEEAIKAIATPADKRDDHQQDLVNDLLLERNLTSVGQSDPVPQPKLHSALPADERANEPASDVASTRSLAPASILERGDLATSSIDSTSSASSVTDPSEAALGESHFEPNVTAPADPLPASLASQAPSTSSIQELPAEEEALDRELTQGSSTTHPSSTSNTSHASATDKNGQKASKAHGILNKAIGKIEAVSGKIIGNSHLKEVGTEKHAAGAAEIQAAKAE